MDYGHALRLRVLAKQRVRLQETRLAVVVDLAAALTFRRIWRQPVEQSRTRWSKDAPLGMAPSALDWSGIVVPPMAAVQQRRLLTRRTGRRPVVVLDVATQCRPQPVAVVPSPEICS